MDALSYFLCSVYAVFSKNVLVLLTLYREAYAGVIGLVLIELVVLAGQYCIQDNTGQRTYCQSGQSDGDLGDHYDSLRTYGSQCRGISSAERAVKIYDHYGDGSNWIKQQCDTTH